MRYELTDYEWAAIRPMLPNKPRGVPRVNDRRVLNGIFWVLRSGAPWRDLPEAFGPYTTCYNRFVRWRRAGVWSHIIDALAAAHDAAVQMIDTSIVRVHQHGACITRNQLGTANADVVVGTRDWLSYEFPLELLGRMPSPRWRGQTQQWFLMRFRGADDEIDVATEHPEFSAWKWVPVDHLVNLIVPFKRELYRGVLKEFAPYLSSNESGRT